MKEIKILIFALLLPFAIFAQNNSQQFFVFLNTNPNKAVLDTSIVNDLQRRHLANIDRLYEEGKITAAGPFYGGGGLFVFQESSIENVYDLMKTDPAIAANRFILEVYPLEFINGLIGQFIEPVEMVSYSFIRIQKEENKIVRSKLNELIHIYGKEVLSAAIFSDNSGGFIVLETDHSKLEKEFESIEKESALIVILKQIYIAKGTFKREPKK